MKWMLVPCLGVLAAGTPHVTDDAALSALLKKQTQEFSDAGQRGDAATLDRYLDPDVVFTNETGGIATKKDLVDGASPSPGRPRRPRGRLHQPAGWRGSRLQEGGAFMSR